MVALRCPSGPNKHQSAVTCLQFCRGLVLSSSDDGTVKLWDLKTGAWLRDVVALQSRGSGQDLIVFCVSILIMAAQDVALSQLAPTNPHHLIPSPRFSAGGVVWRIRASDTRLVCAAGSRNGTEETKLLVLDFDPDDMEKDAD